MFRSSQKTPRELGIVGVCGSGIIEVLGEMFLTGIMDANGVIQGHTADKIEPGGAR